MSAFCVAIVLSLASVGAVPALEDPLQNAVPAWVVLARESKLPLHCEAIESELWATPDEARRDVLERAVDRAARFAAESAPRLRLPPDRPTWLVEDHMLREPIFFEEIDWTYGPMYRAHLLLDLSPDAREVLLSHWHHELVQKRMNQVGGGLGFLLVCVATLLGYLRMDDATRGYYSRWLAAGAVGVVGASAAALVHWVS